MPGACGYPGDGEDLEQRRGLKGDNGVRYRILGRFLKNGCLLGRPGYVRGLWGPYSGFVGGHFEKLQW